MTAVALTGTREGTRWTVSAMAVAIAHAGVAAALLLTKTIPAPPSEPPSAILFELAPLSVAPAAKPVELPPGPEQVEAEPPPPRREPEPPPEPEPLPEMPEPPPEVVAEVVLPKPPPPRPRIVERPPEPVKLRPVPVREAKPPAPTPAPQPPAPTTTAPPVALAPAPVPAAPSQTASAVPADAMRTWQSYLLAHLERHKRYPRNAQLRRQEGVVHLRFVMDREGRVATARLERSSGHTSLDDETLALIERAQPLPPPPDEMARERIEIVVPVQFFLR